MKGKRNHMVVKEYSLRLENLLRNVKGESYRGSDAILLNPYQEIISALECRIPQDKLNKFKIYYQAIDGRSLK